MGNLEKKLEVHKKILDYHEMESMILAEEVINNRLKIKKTVGEKIRVLFICFRPQVWNSLKTVYEAMKKDPMFETFIVVTPIRKLRDDGSWSIDEYEEEGGLKFWESEGCISAYNSMSNCWYDPRSINPDYVFYQQPYNPKYHEHYKSWIVSKYAKICYIPYFIPIVKNDLFESLHPKDFFRNIAFIFSVNQYYTKELEDYKSVNWDVLSKVVTSGMPRFDLLKDNNKKDEFKNKFSCLWTPRWSISEGTSFFLDFKDEIVEYARQHDDYYMILRPHPHMFREVIREKYLSISELEEYKDVIKDTDNMYLDETEDYLNTFSNTDCLIADYTSLLCEYIMTGKPIIYCHKRNVFDEAGKRLSEGFYWAHNWQEVEGFLDMLKAGEDPLRKKRIALAEELYGKSKGNVGEVIKDFIKADAYK